MPLIVEDTLREGIAPQMGVSPMYICVDSKYLSKQYRVPFLVKCWLEGEILEVSRFLGELSIEERRVFKEHVVGKHVKLYLMQAFITAYDNLYFDDNSWAILRDAGVFPGEHKLKVRLSKLIIEPERKTLSLYPYRDIVVSR